MWTLADRQSSGVYAIVCEINSGKDCTCSSQPVATSRHFIYVSKREKCLTLWHKLEGALPTDWGEPERTHTCIPDPAIYHKRNAPAFCSARDYSYYVSIKYITKYYNTHNYVKHEDPPHNVYSMRRISYHNSAGIWVHLCRIVVISILKGNMS